MLAAAGKHTETVRALLEAGANPNLRNKKREQAHMLVSGHEEIAKLLEQHRAHRKWSLGLF
jgi:cytohesin